MRAHTLKLSWSKVNLLVLFPSEINDRQGYPYVKTWY